MKQIWPCPNCGGRPITGEQLDSDTDGFGHAYAGKHLVCSKCGKGWDTWWHDRPNCTSPHGKPHVPSSIEDRYPDSMAGVVRNQIEHVEASMRVDRSDWSDDQWVADARELVNDIHGSVLDLVNGHITAMLRKLDTVKQCKHPHITSFREVYRNGEFEGVDYDECEVSGMKANRQ